MSMYEFRSRREIGGSAGAWARGCLKGADVGRRFHSLMADCKPSLHPEHGMIEYEHLEIKDIPLDNIPTQQ